MNQQTSPSNLGLVKPSSPLTAVRNLLVADRNMSYLLVILLAALGAYLYTLRSQSIFSCPASGYGTDTYLAYCHANHYGDYDHGAFWFGLEPKIRDSVRTANVLFLGNSRLQFGFTSDATREWFASNTASYYLMGFAYWENYLFEQQLLRRLQPQAKVYVINIDTFFENSETPPAQILMHGSDATDRYNSKRSWQRIHAQVCGRLPVACGSDQAFFRSRTTGGYFLEGGRVTNVPVAYDDNVDQKMAHDYIERGNRFLATLPVERQCVLLTMVPSAHTPIGTARVIADALGAKLIAPEPDDVNTFDKSHMDRASAEIWSKDFFEAAGPRIRRCLGKAPAVYARN